MLNSFLSLQKDSEQDNGHSSDLKSEKKWYSINENSPQSEWDNIAEKMMVTLAESRHPIFRVTSPVSRGVLENKSGGKWSIQCADHETIKNCFSHNYFCKSAQSLRSSRRKMWRIFMLSWKNGWPVVRRQSNSSFVPSVIKTNVPLNNDDHVHIDLLLQRYRERIEKLPQQDRMSKFCTDARFLTTIEIGQYFMTKDTEEFSQFTDSVAVVSTLCQEMKTYLNQKVGFESTTKLVPYWVATFCLQSKYGVEIRIKSVNKDNSHFMGQNFSHGYELEQQRPRWQRARKLRNAVRRMCVKIECKLFCNPIKSQSKTTKTRFCQLIHKNYSYWRQNLDRYWTKRIFNLRLWSVEETDSSSSSWKSTPRRRWSGWTLEKKR